MRQVTFTITEAEIRKIAGRDLSDEKIQFVLSSVESDESLWKEIRHSVVCAINWPWPK